MLSSSIEKPSATSSRDLVSDLSVAIPPAHPPLIRAMTTPGSAAAASPSPSPSPAYSATGTPLAKHNLKYANFEQIVGPLESTTLMVFLLHAVDFCPAEPRTKESPIVVAARNLNFTVAGKQIDGTSGRDARLDCMQVLKNVTTDHAFEVVNIYTEFNLGYSGYSVDTTDSLINNINAFIDDHAHRYQVVTNIATLNAVKVGLKNSIAENSQRIAVNALPENVAQQPSFLPMTIPVRIFLRGAGGFVSPETFAAFKLKDPEILPLPDDTQRVNLLNTSFQKSYHSGTFELCLKNLVKFKNGTLIASPSTPLCSPPASPAIGANLSSPSYEAFMARTKIPAASSATNGELEVTFQRMRTQSNVETVLSNNATLFARARASSASDVPNHSTPQWPVPSPEHDERFLCKMIRK